MTVVLGTSGACLGVAGGVVLASSMSVGVAKKTVVLKVLEVVGLEWPQLFWWRKHEEEEKCD
eukprot:3185770-Ditylum_brightwellii.AAC.1